MRKIICVTLNPAMDKTILIDQFDLGRINTIKDVHYEIGGRGVNVSKVLNNFGFKSIVTGFSGGIWADTFRTTLLKLGIETKFFKLIHDSRVNTKLIDIHSGVCTTINETGPNVPEEMVERFIQSFTIMCNYDDIIILTGGLPPGVPMDIYYTLTKIAKEKGAYVILDSWGGDRAYEAFLLAAKAEPDVVKVNYRDYLSKEDWQDMPEDKCIGILEKTKDFNVKNVLVSLGKKGAFFISNDKCYYADAIEVGVDLKHPVGAGDAMLAALVMGKIEEFDAVTTMKYAVACGAACVMCKNTNSCIPMQVNELLSQVEVHEINQYLK
ncbi:MAG: 1-phosphofructokinase family hexose kinase [Cellulosilyticaceae bacterium]